MWFWKILDYEYLRKYKDRSLYYAWNENGVKYCITQDAYEDYQNMLKEK